MDALNSCVTYVATSLPSGLEFEDCFKRFFTDKPKPEIIELVEIPKEAIKSEKENYGSRLKLIIIIVGCIVGLVFLTGTIAIAWIKLNQSRKIN